MPEDAEAERSPEPARRLHVLVTGRVQGVNFRYATRAAARELGLRGWVRNLRDGSVEAVFEGEEAALRAVLDWCRQGPPAARVEDVEATWEAAQGEVSGFSVRG
ncbi:MAG: acylphosphatase [Anaerolineales bacterium]